MHSACDAKVGRVARAQTRRYQSYRRSSPKGHGSLFTRVYRLLLEEWDPTEAKEAGTIGSRTLVGPLGSTICILRLPLRTGRFMGADGRCPGLCQLPLVPGVADPQGNWRPLRREFSPQLADVYWDRP